MERENGRERDFAVCETAQAGAQHLIMRDIKGTYSHLAFAPKEISLAHDDSVELQEY